MPRLSRARSKRGGCAQQMMRLKQCAKRTSHSYASVRRQPNGNLDLRYVRRVCEQIGAALKDKQDRHVVAIRSTVLPGTVRNIVIPILEEVSGAIAGSDFGVCHNPEFLREGSAVYDFNAPPKTVIGELEPCSGAAVAALYQMFDAPLIRTELEVSEMIKYVDNSWHALKIGFANEVGNLSKAFGVDAHEVMGIFCQDQKLNISREYLVPGFAFGGSCLPKDCALWYIKLKRTTSKRPF